MRSRLVTPLHLMILLHHNGIVSPYAEGTEHGRSEAVREYTQDLVNWDLIEPWPDNPYPNPWRTTARGKAHVDCLCYITIPLAT